MHRQSMRQPTTDPAALANGHKVPCGDEQNMPTMPRRRLFGSLGAKRCPSSGAPDEKEDDEEDEGDDCYSE